MFHFPCSGDLRFPKDMYTNSQQMSSARRTIRALLDPNVLKRLGCQRRGALDVKECSFFKDVPWSSLVRKKVTAPWVPKLKGPFDSTFFDEEYDENEEAGKVIGNTSAAAAAAAAAKLAPDWDREFDMISHHSSSSSSSASASVSASVSVPVSPFSNQYVFLLGTVSLC